MKPRPLPLAALALAVLAAHLLALGLVRLPVIVAPAATPATWQTRNIAPQTAPHGMPRQPATLTAAAPLRTSATGPSPPAPAPAPAPALVPLPARPTAAALAPAAPAAPATAPVADTMAAAVAMAPAQASTPSTSPAPPETIAAAAPRSASRFVPFRLAGPVRLHYEIAASLRGVPVAAQAELNWQHDSQGYEARMEVQLPLLPRRVQTSAGRITAEGLAPRRYSERSRHEEAAHFERDKGKVVFSSNRPEAALAAGMQDRLSLLLQLGALMAGAPGRYPRGTDILVPTAGTRDAEPWHFTVEAEEELALPGGTVKAVRLQRLPRKEFDQKIELWLAPGMAYVPVRLRLTQPNGDWLDQQWSATDKG
ncbi:MAG TPA: DUF3108 domain-containing protein [Ramlibacter sp.]|nr:DUF3108 domain-containing protein [Ramlibacter sp.]